jgi:hypothetical protein
MQDNILKYLFEVSIMFYHFDDHRYLSNFLSVCHQRVSRQQTDFCPFTLWESEYDVRAANRRRPTIRERPKAP